jgi:hypothetical protein
VFIGTEDGAASEEGEEGEEAPAEGEEAPAEPEGGEGERGGPGDEEEAPAAAEGEAEAEAETDPWAKRDNREKLQKLGVNVVSSTKEVLFCFFVELIIAETRCGPEFSCQVLQ